MKKVERAEKGESGVIHSAGREGDKNKGGREENTLNAHTYSTRTLLYGPKSVWNVRLLG